LEFLQAASDYFEPLRRDDSDSILAMLEDKAAVIFGGPDWSNKLDGNLLTRKSSKNKRPPYDGTKLQDLLRLIRNKVRVQP